MKEAANSGGDRCAQETGALASRSDIPRKGCDRFGRSARLVAIVFCDRGSGNYESDQARAKQDKTANCHSEEAVRSEFITHGTSPIVRPCPNGITVLSHSQKDSLPKIIFNAG
jgi:hypothetical protein